MDFRDTPDEAEFRSGLKRWLRNELGAPQDQRPHVGHHSVEVRRAWSRRLHDAGYAGLTWSPDYGGQGKPHSYQAIFLEESGRAHAPEHVGVIGLGMAGPTIAIHGTEQQKKQHLPAILAGDTVFCQGFSEPGSGSDLASISTRAERNGDTWVVNGQKVWSSWAHIADYCILLTRSDPDERGHRGMTYFLLDMRTPGVTVRPLRQITGDPEFNEIFFDDVRIPADDVLDAPGNGWAVAMTTLLNERGTLGIALTAQLEDALLRLVDTVHALGRAADPVVRDRMGDFSLALEGLRYTNYRSLTALLKTGVPGPEGSVAKLQWSEINQRLTTYALELLGDQAQLDGDAGFWAGYWQFQQLRSRGNTIEAGTSEVLRTIIAERLVGLPRSR